MLLLDKNIMGNFNIYIIQVSILNAYNLSKISKENYFEVNKKIRKWKLLRWQYLRIQWNIQST